MHVIIEIVQVVGIIAAALVFSAGLVGCCLGLPKLGESLAGMGA